MSETGTMMISALVESAAAVSPFVIGEICVATAEVIRQARRYGTRGALHHALRVLSESEERPTAW